MKKIENQPADSAASSSSSEALLDGAGTACPRNIKPPVPGTSCPRPSTRSLVELKQQINDLCRQMDKSLMHRLIFLDAESRIPTAAETVRPLVKGESET